MSRPKPLAPKTFSAEFLNIDLDLKSSADPSPLVETWGRRVSTLHTDKLGRRHWLRLMLAKQPQTPAEAIRRFASLVDQLPSEGATIWARAYKEFDIGIQAGFERRSGEWLLKPETLQTLADLGAHVRITVYSPLLLMEKDAPPKRRR
jgi:hypothetical protein